MVDVALANLPNEHAGMSMHLHSGVFDGRVVPPGPGEVGVLDADGGPTVDWIRRRRVLRLTPLLPGF